MGASASGDDRATCDLWCPSARPDQQDAVVFGVRTAAECGNRIGYLSATVPAEPELLQLAEPAEPLEVFRFAAPCAEAGCVHFAGQQCSLASRIVEQTAVVVSIAPPCAVRSKCRWFAQEGTAACRRCPQVVTRESGTNVEVAAAAMPVVPAPDSGAGPGATCDDSSGRRPTGRRARPRMIGGG